MNILERFPIADYGQNSTQALHVTAEALKLVFADPSARRSRHSSVDLTLGAPAEGRPRAL
jgi:gamma-glutamyltranspeptidase